LTTALVVENHRRKSWLYSPADIDRIIWFDAWGEDTYKQHQVGGHAISVFIPAGGLFPLRICDMNGGEWLIECQDHWRTWSNGLDASMAADKDGPINFVEVMDLQRK
jgi:hypothetical protein